MKNIIRLIIIIVFIGFFSCGKSEMESNASLSIGSDGYSVNGSLSRFTVYNDYLYTVDNQNLSVFEISSQNKATLIKKESLGFNIETITAFNNTLFIGSSWGMYIYDITIGSSPLLLSNYSHIYSCDPVAVDSNYAYVSLNSIGNCGRFTNEVQIIDINNLRNPYQVGNIELIGPKGLGVLNNKLFVCDYDKLKVYDITNPLIPLLKSTFNITSKDVIPLDTLLLVIGDNGLYQYYYKNDSISLLSTILNNKK